MAVDRKSISETLDADGNSEVIQLWPGGSGAFVAQGTWGGGTATLQFSSDGGTTWTAVGPDTTLEADGGGVFTLPTDVKVRVNLNGSTNPSLKVVVSPAQPYYKGA